MDPNSLGRAIVIAFGLYFSGGAILTIAGTFGLRNVLKNTRKTASAATISFLVGALVFLSLVVMPVMYMSESMGIWFGLLIAYGVGLPVVAWLTKDQNKSTSEK
jgi:hypothetical protein